MTISNDQDSETAVQSDQGEGPVGQGDYVVQQGDCMSSIAFEHGFFWKSLWDLAENAELKRTRKNPNVLFSGDRLTIPARRIRHESGSTEVRHCFKRKGVPEVLSIVFLDKERKPRAGIPYKIVIDGDTRRGNTDSDGQLKESIPPDARHGMLTLGEDRQVETFDLHLGHLDPVSDIGGAQMRLQNLGYDCGSVDGEETPEFVEALEKFQADQKLEVTGKLDDTTRNKLEELHHC